MTPPSLFRRTFGFDATAERALAWAQQNHFRLTAKVAFCSHALQGKSCPPGPRGVFTGNRCCPLPAAFDHAHVWQRPDRSTFLLAHIYSPDYQLALQLASPIARSRGLHVQLDPAADWYDPSHAAPLRYEPLTFWHRLGDETDEGL